MENLKELATEYEALRSSYNEMLARIMRIQDRKNEAKKRFVDALAESGEEEFTAAGWTYRVEENERFVCDPEDDEAKQLVKSLVGPDAIDTIVDEFALNERLKSISAAYLEIHPNSAEKYPAEFEELFAHLSLEKERALIRVNAE